MAACRLLGIEPDWQRHLFEFYQAMLEAHIAQLRREQKYDDGIVDVKGSEISIVGQPQVWLFEPWWFQDIVNVAQA